MGSRNAIETGVIGGAGRPQHRRCCLLARRALLARLVESGADSANDKAAHGRRVAETDLGLGRMDVHVDLFERHRQEQGCDRVAVAGDEVAIGSAERPDEQPVLYRAVR